VKRALFEAVRTVLRLGSVERRKASPYILYTLNRKMESNAKIILQRVPQTINENTKMSDRQANIFLRNFTLGFGFLYLHLMMIECWKRIV
jgi:hypothetical protein